MSSYNTVIEWQLRQGALDPSIGLNYGGDAAISDITILPDGTQRSVIAKSATDAFDRAETQFFDPKFSADLIVYPYRQVSALSTLPKTTYQQKGDAIKIISADPATESDVTLGVVGTTQLNQYYDTPTMAKIIGADSIGIRCKIVVTKWKMDLDYIIKNEAQYVPQVDASFLKEYFAGHHTHAMDKMLLTSVDTPASNNLESIDRAISSSAETGLTSVSTDPDIHGTMDRSASTVYDSQVDTSSSSRTLSLSMIDTVLTSMGPYVSGPNNVYSIAHPLVLNMVQDLVGSKQRFNDGIGKVELTLQGINTRPGVNAGFQVSTYSGGGIGPVPLLSDYNVGTAAVGSLPASNGSIYFIDKNFMELRQARATSYYATKESDYLNIDYLEQRHLILTAQELIVPKPSAHGKVTYLSGV